MACTLHLNKTQKIYWTRKDFFLMAEQGGRSSSTSFRPPTPPLTASPDGPSPWVRFETLT